QLVGHGRQELRLVPAGQLQLGTLLLELLEELCVQQGEGRLAREGLEEVDGLLGEVPRLLAADDQASDDLVLAQHRYGDQRPPSGVVEDLQVGVEVDAAQV